MKLFDMPVKLSLMLWITIFSITIFSCSSDDDDAAVINDPAISSFAPAAGLPGTTVTITGDHFNASPAGNQVTFNGTSATITSATKTQLVVTVPAAATSGKISVSTSGKTATSASDFTILQTSITQFTPASGMPGTTVTITGSNFSTTVADHVVKFNGVTATVTSATSSQLVVTVPETAVTGKITVTLGANTITTATDFTVLETTISAFTPASGMHGTTVTITGTNFSTTPADNTVKFNGVAATVSAATATDLTVSVPAEATTGKITVTVSGKTKTSATDFTIVTPTITSFSPDIAAAGISITITGTNFSPVPGNNIVKINGVTATVTAVSSTQLTVTVPAGATTGPITVKVGQATATGSGNFEACSGAPELVISNVMITNTPGATSFTVSFKVTNVGSVNADISKMSLQNYASVNTTYDGGDVAASGYGLNSAPTLAPGESYTTPAYGCNIVGGNTASHPYLIITFSDYPEGSVAECNVSNNVVVKPFN